MDTGRLKRSALLALIMCMLLLVVLSSATLAWFSANRLVGTTRVSARTAEQSVSLEISNAGGDSFRPAQETSIGQVNRTELSYLLPVSTADLQGFVACGTMNGDGFATAYTEVKDEANYFHGRVYLRAVVSDGTLDNAVDLYLDESAGAGGALAAKDAEDSLLLNAARLGLVFNNDPATARIFRLSEEENEKDDRRVNTMLDGVKLEDGMVLRLERGVISAVQDPAGDLADHTVSEQSDTLPEEPLFRLEPGEICPVDIYFYLEGCDPDCTEALSFDGADLHLGFFGILS